LESRSRKLAGGLLQLRAVIRFCFESGDEFQRHLRLGDGVLFVPGCQGSDKVGERVVVEIVFPHSDDALVVYGRLRSVARDGIWLEAPSVRAAALWTPGPEALRRRARRLPCDMLVEVRASGTHGWLCRALDLSASGLRLATGTFETGVEGDVFDLTLFPQDAKQLNLRARLCWVRGRGAGFELLSPPPLLRPVLRAVAKSHLDVLEVVHSGACTCLSAPVATGQRQPYKRL
jgi:hypothetical protein